MTPHPEHRSAVALTVHMRTYLIILPQPLPFGPPPIAIESPSDIWIADKGFGLPDAAKGAFSQPKRGLLSG